MLKYQGSITSRNFGQKYVLAEDSRNYADQALRQGFCNYFPGTFTFRFFRGEGLRTARLWPEEEGLGSMAFGARSA